MIDYIASLDSTHWVLLTFALGSTIIAIVQFMSQPEMRALWADVRDRLLNPVQARDEARLRSMGRMDGWRTDLQRRFTSYPCCYRPIGGTHADYCDIPPMCGDDDALAALRKSDAERRARRRQS